MLKTEIKNLKDNLKESVDKNQKQERYIKQIHEKIGNVENQIKKLSAPKIDMNKKFTKEDLKNTLENISNLKNLINENRPKIKNSTKLHEENLINFTNLNKKIENDFKENDKVECNIYSLDE